MLKDHVNYLIGFYFNIKNSHIPVFHLTIYLKLIPVFNQDEPIRLPYYYLVYAMDDDTSSYAFLLMEA